MNDRTLFTTCPDSEFFGRASEIGYISARAAEAPRRAPAIFLFGKRWTGKTEVLRRAHQRLFWEQAEVAPVYYQFKGYGSVEDFSEDFLKEVLKQCLAFRKRDVRIVRDGISLERIERLLVDEDLYGLADLAALHKEARRAGDAMAALRNAVTSPEAVLSRSGLAVYLMLDDVELASSISSITLDCAAARELMGSLSSGPNGFVAASAARGGLEGASFNGSAEAIELEGLEAETASSMLIELCRQHAIDFDPEILKLASIKLGGNPMYMKSVVWAAAKSGGALTSLKEFAELYTSELFDGNMGMAFKSSIRLKGLNDLRLLHASAVSSPLTDELLLERFRFGSGELRETAEALCATGLVELSMGSISWSGDHVAKDFVNAVYETRVKGRSEEEVRTSMAREILKQGYGFKSSAALLRLKEKAAEIIRSFNSQKTLKVLFRNQAFASRYKNGSYKLPSDRKEEEEIALPEVAGCFDSVRLESGEAGSPIIIAQGFQNGRYDSGNEVVWMISVKDSAAPVNLGDVESFLRRSKILKENFRSGRLMRWMIGREGFTAEAHKRMDTEGVFSSDATQLKILGDSLQEKDSAARLKAAGKVSPVKEFEVVLPSASKAELVAARAVEEIGTEMGFGDNAIGQIKAALVEACINAFEHGKANSSKVFLKFAASSDRLTITVQNGGMEFNAPSAKGAAEAETGLPRKRGWGFELMKGLMDEVRFEKVKGGARIVLVKYLVRKGDGRNGQEV